MAAELLDYYTAEQLRMHFLSLGLGMRSVSFQPKPLNPAAAEDSSDPVTKEGFLLSNVFNRIIRTCFYDAQKYLGGKMPVGEVDAEIRKASKYMAKAKADADKADDNELRRKWMINVFHMIKTAAVLLHPIVPKGTEVVREYLCVDETLWSWDRIFDTFASTLGGVTEHDIKFLEPRTDFFTRHESQF